MRVHTPLVIPALAAGFLSLTGTAFAQDAEAVAKSFEATLAQGGKMTVSHEGDVSGSGDEVAINGLTLTPKDGGTVIAFDEVTLTGVAEEDDGYTADEIVFDGGTFSGDATGTIGNVRLEEAIFGETPEAEQETPGLLFHRLVGSDVSVTPKDRNEPVTVSGFTMTSEDIVDGVPQTSQGSVEDLVVPGSYVPADQKMKPSDLGYDELAFNIEWAGSRDPESQDLKLDKVALTLKDGGTLMIDGNLGNVAMPGAETAAQPMAGIATMNVSDFTLRYEDDSLTGRVLDFYGKQQGMDGDKYAEQLAAAVPFMLSAMQNADFQKKVSDAVSTFLRDPQSLTVTIAPDEPMSGAEILQIAGSAPQTLPDVLNISVTANQSR
ncbi:hypothetical protein NYQ83_01305 [Afifella sp. JA880]|uniref:hypothetical protein n=1 Tax=Afifella sp. JA880 TaxID=2975280 RepID=UPI0021BA9DC7|nr:hypothetical protein [Afifella sp. JA880]MCT8265897.1 hypothetical protein [Afifella sp. JA880]